MRTIIFLTAILFSQLIHAQGRRVFNVFINEIQVSNVDRFLDPSFNYGGWIEIYNAGTTEATLSKMVLRHRDSKGNISEQVLSSSHGKMKPKGFCVLWFDHNSRDGFYGPNARNQIPFQLDSDGGRLELIGIDGKTIDIIEYPSAIARCSYMRVQDGSFHWDYTSYPTPGMTNNDTPVSSRRLLAPVVNTQGKVFDNPFQFLVSIPEDCTLYYTTDGSTPRKGISHISKDGVFWVRDTSIVYRFLLSADGYLDSPVITRSFIKTSRDYYLPILNVSTHPDNLFNDSIGLYVRGTNGRIANNSITKANQNMDWERPVNVDFFVREKEGNYVQCFSQEAEFSIFGGWSRFLGGDSIFECKPSFKLKSNKAIDNNTHFPCSIFPEKPYIRLKSFLVRNGGQDSSTRFWDPAVQELARTSGLYIDCQSWQPAHVFLNGSYLGMMNLREESNRRFAYSNYGIDNDEIDQWENEFEMKAGETDRIDHWYKLCNYLSVNPKDSILWDDICHLVDVDEYCNYMALEIYTGNYDWLTGDRLKNIKGFCSRVDNGKIHTVLYDMDESFGMTDLINQIYQGDKQRQLQIFKNMLRYEPFRKQFIDAFCIIGGSVYSPERCESILYEMARKTSIALKWEGYNPMIRAKELFNRISDRNWRYPTLMNNFKEALNLSEYHQVCLSSNLPQGKIRLNDQEIPTGRFDGALFPPITLKALSPSGHRFYAWYDKNNNVISMDSIFDIDFTLEEDTFFIKAIFKPIEMKEQAKNHLSPIKINEISSNNNTFISEYDKKGSWIELYNATDRDIDIAGMYISNDTKYPQKIQIPTSLDKKLTIIPSHGYCLIWCDEREPRTQLHVPFKLSNADGSYVMIQAANSTWKDSLVYCSQDRWTTFGRYPDGQGKGQLMNRPSFGETNRLCTFYSEIANTNNDYIRTIPGDVNRDGKIDISDVLVTVNYILGVKDSSIFYTLNADINTDLKIDINDVMGIVDKILCP